jgi:hypothetical protein
MTKLYNNALSLVNTAGAPSYFMTVTASSAWPELTEELNKYDPP